MQVQSHHKYSDLGWMRRDTGNSFIWSSHSDKTLFSFLVVTLEIIFWTQGSTRRTLKESPEELDDCTNALKIQVAWTEINQLKLASILSTSKRWSISVRPSDVWDPCDHKPFFNPNAQNWFEALQKMCRTGLKGAYIRGFKALDIWFLAFGQWDLCCHMQVPFFAHCKILFKS